jgi:hypothetical protein
MLDRKTVRNISHIQQRFLGIRPSGKASLISFSPLVFLCIVLALPSGQYQSRQGQRRQGGAMPVLTLNDANSPLLSYDGQRMVVGPEVGLAEVYELATGHKLQTFRVPNSADYAISPDGKQLGIWGDETTWSDGRHYKSKAVFWLFDIDTGKEIRHNDAVIMRDGVSVGFLEALRNSKNVSGDLRLVANLAPSENVVPSVTLRNLETLELVRQFSFGEYSKSGVAGTVAMTPDAKVIAATRRDLYGSSCKQTVVWDASTGKELLRLPFEATTISLSRDGARRLTIPKMITTYWKSGAWKTENAFPRLASNLVHSGTSLAVELFRQTVSSSLRAGETTYCFGMLTVEDWLRRNQSRMQVTTLSGPFHSAVMVGSWRLAPYRKRSGYGESLKF